MNKHVKKLLSFVTRKSYSSSFEYSPDTPTDLYDVTLQNDDYSKSTNQHPELILNPSGLTINAFNDYGESSSRTSKDSGGAKNRNVTENIEFPKIVDGGEKLKNSHHKRNDDDVKIHVHSSVPTCLPPPFSFEHDVTTGSGNSHDIITSGGWGVSDVSGVSGSSKEDTAGLNIKDLQGLTLETPRLSDEVELTEDQKAELKQAFSMFEKTGKGRILARDLGELLRCLGWNPSEQDLEEARHELELSTRGTISFSEVEAYIARRGGIYYGNNAEEDIMVAFQVLDKTGSGKITVSDFRHFMTTMGERMSHEEVEELIECSTRGGKDYIEYRDLVHAVQQSPT